MNDEWVAITDNADPMNVVVYRRSAELSGDRECARCRSSTRAGAPATTR
jgi:hypothetical protein